MVVTFFVLVDVQDAAGFEVEVDPFIARPLKQGLTRRNRQARGFDGVLFVVRNSRHELGHPAQLVPARFRIDQQRGVAAEHPLQPLDDG